MTKRPITFLLLAVFSALSLTADARCASCARAWQGAKNRHSHGRRRRRGYDYHRRRSPDVVDLVSDLFSLPLFVTKTWYRQQATLESGQEELGDLRSPRYSISENDDQVALSMELPGVSPEDVSVEVENGDVLRIQVTHSKNLSDKSANFERSFRFDRDRVDTEKLSVNLSRGVLSLQAPKKPSGVKRIPIEINGGRDEDTRSKIKPTTNNYAIHARSNTKSKPTRIGVEINEKSDPTSDHEDDFVISEEEDFEY